MHSRNRGGPIYFSKITHGLSVGEVNCGEFRLLNPGGLKPFEMCATRASHPPNFGSVCFFVYVIRRHWFRDSLSDR
jgi:hypothetical protein